MVTLHVDADRCKSCGYGQDAAGCKGCEELSFGIYKNIEIVYNLKNVSFVSCSLYTDTFIPLFQSLS